MPNLTHTNNGYGFKDTKIVIIYSATAPTVSTGAGYADKGSMCLCGDGNFYINTGTITTPAWKKPTLA